MSSPNPQEGQPPSDDLPGGTAYVMTRITKMEEGKKKYYITCPCNVCLKNNPTTLILYQTSASHMTLQAGGGQIGFTKKRKTAHESEDGQVYDHPIKGIENVGPNRFAHPLPTILPDEYPNPAQMEGIERAGQREDQQQRGIEEEDDFYPGDSPPPVKTFPSILHDFARLKTKGGMSAGLYNDMMEYVTNVATWFIDPAHSNDIHIIPRTWDHHILLLEKESQYVKPVPYWVCMDQQHGHITQDLLQECPEPRCRKRYFKNEIYRSDTIVKVTGQAIPAKFMPTPAQLATKQRGKSTPRRDIELQPADHLIPFYYLPIRDRITRLMSNNLYCFKLLAHWRERSHWFRKKPTDPLNEVLKEAWDGTGFRSYSWFFDPRCEWTLPQLCTSCQHPFDGISLHNKHRSGEPTVIMDCPACLQEVEVPYRRTCGDPRNIALQFHADAFYPSSTTQKQNLDMMSITFLNMSKMERTKTRNIKLIGFIRKTKRDGKIYKANPRSQEPFYKPMLDELQDLLINGLDIDYQWEEPSLTKHNIVKGPAKIRVLLFNQAGDYVGLQPLCGIKSKGKISCRHCESQSELHASY